MGIRRCIGSHFHALAGLIIMGLHFYKSYYNGAAHLQDVGGQKIQVCGDLKIVYNYPSKGS